MFSATQRGHTLNGILLVALFAITAQQLASFSLFTHLGKC